jgi:amidase
VSVASRLAVALLAACVASRAGSVPAADPPVPRTAADRDLLDVTVARLHGLYDARAYTVMQVVRWHLDRIDRFNGVYGAVETVFREEAVARAAMLDAALATGGTAAARGALFGVPIVVKANTSIEGQVTTAGWEGFRVPGHELVAPQSATIVEKFLAAGAVILGHTNMPDLANSDTNRSSSFGRTGNAYDVRVSPGGSSGGTVTAVAANFAVLGNGTDTGNSIRMPAATSALVGFFPTRGLVSIAGIAPLDWLLDNTGPIARTVDDAAVALRVMAGSDPLDPRTAQAPAAALAALGTMPAESSLRGKRFGVPAFILAGDGIPFHGIPADVPEASAEELRKAAAVPLRPETRSLFLRAVEALRAAGAEVLVDDTILPAAFARTASRVSTYAYMEEGTRRFLAEFGPPAYRSPEAYAAAVGRPLFASSLGAEDAFRVLGEFRIEQRRLESDPNADRWYRGPRHATLRAYLETLERLRLDGCVYPAIQMPPPDETMPQDGRLSEGPRSATSWVNMIGVPAVVVPAGLYDSGLPFGLEFSARPWDDATLLAMARAWERAAPPRVPPVLVERGLRPFTTAREATIHPPRPRPPR